MAVLDHEMDVKVCKMAIPNPIVRDRVGLHTSLLETPLLHAVHAVPVSCAFDRMGRLGTVCGMDIVR